MVEASENPCAIFSYFNALFNFVKKGSEILIDEFPKIDELDEIAKKFKEKRVLHGKLIKELRYGENPHQKASLYSKYSDIGLDQLNGKELSFNNYGDIFASLSISRSLPKNIGTVIVKHSNPCGVSTNKNHKKSYISALASDPISAFGGLVSCNFKINTSIAKEMSKNFYEVII